MDNQTLKPRELAEQITAALREASRDATLPWDAMTAIIECFLPRSSDTEPPKLRPCEFRYARERTYGEVLQWERGWFHMLNSEGLPQVESERGELFSVRHDDFRFTGRAAAVTDTKGVPREPE